MRIPRKLLVGAIAGVVLVAGFITASVYPPAGGPYETLAVHTVGLAGLFIVGHVATDVAAVVRGSRKAE